MKWTNKFKKINGNPAKNTPRQNSLEPDENGYNLNGKCVSQEEISNISKGYSPNKSDYNLDEDYPTIIPDNPIHKSQCNFSPLEFSKGQRIPSIQDAYEKEEFDPGKTKAMISGTFLTHPLTGTDCSGCMIAFFIIALSPILLGFGWSSIIAYGQEPIAGFFIIAFLFVILFAIFANLKSKCTITFYLTKKDNLFVEIAPSKEKKLSQITKYNYFISTISGKYNMFKNLVITAKSIDEKIFSFSGAINSGVVSLNEQILFIDNYSAAYSAEKGSAFIEKIIYFLKSSEIHREKCLR
jgi:hypothetical protein